MRWGEYTGIPVRRNSTWEKKDKRKRELSMTSKASLYRALRGRAGVQTLRAGWPLKTKYNMGQEPLRAEARLCPACRKG